MEGWYFSFILFSTGGDQIGLHKTLKCKETKVLAHLSTHQNVQLLWKIMPIK